MGHDLVQRIADHVFGRGIAGRLSVRGVGEQQHHALSPQLRDTEEIGGLAHDRRVVQLEVAGVEDVTRGGADRQPGGVRDAVGHAHPLHCELAQADGLAHLDHMQVRLLGQLVFMELDRDQPVSEAGAVDGRQLAVGKAELG